MSKVEKNMEPATASMQSWVLGKGYASFIVDLFKIVKSMQVLILPFFFLTKTIGEAHGEFDSRITPCFFKFSIAFISSFTNDMGTLLGACFTGLASPVSMACETRWVKPKSCSSVEKAVLCFINNSSICLCCGGLFPSVARKARFLRYSGKWDPFSWWSFPESSILEFSCPWHEDNPSSDCPDNLSLDCLRCMIPFPTLLLHSWPLAVDSHPLCESKTSTLWSLVMRSFPEWRSSKFSTPCRKSAGYGISATMHLSTSSLKNSAQATSFLTLTGCEFGLSALTFPVTSVFKSTRLLAVIKEYLSSNACSGSISTSPALSWLPSSRCT